MQLAYAQNLGEYFACSFMDRIVNMGFLKAKLELQNIVQEGESHAALAKYYIQDIFGVNGSLRPVWSTVSSHYIPDLLQAALLKIDSSASYPRFIDICAIGDVFVELTGLPDSSLIVDSSLIGEYTSCCCPELSTELFQMLCFRGIPSDTIYNENLVREQFCKKVISQAEQLLK
tara:strand:- start:2246 stop:2767 length:522 start_codon:yes stop_codon:yes gene_type:complete